MKKLIIILLSFTLSLLAEENRLTKFEYPLKLKDMAFLGDGGTFFIYFTDKNQKELTFIALYEYDENKFHLKTGKADQPNLNQTELKTAKEIIGKFLKQNHKKLDPDARKTFIHYYKLIKEKSRTNGSN